MMRPARLAHDFPRGVRPLLFAEAERRRALERDLFEVVDAAGYREIILPVVDASEPYRGVVEEAARRYSYRFIDRDGELLEIRSDFTPMVARSLAPLIEHDWLPLRVSYRGEVVRCEGERLAGEGDSFQIGAELVGDGSLAAEGEILDLAVGLVRRTGSEPLVLLGDARIVEAVLPAASESARNHLRRAIAGKHFEEVERLTISVEEGRRRVLLALCTGIVELADLASYGLDDALHSLVMLGERSGGCARVALDVVGAEPGYYTGMWFRIFDSSGRVELGRGGRYDRLYGRFGYHAPAVGFTLSLDRLEELPCR
jgi:ATP phosphoribosyltransferase regulatory subunit